MIQNYESDHKFPLHKRFDSKFYSISRMFSYPPIQCPHLELFHIKISSKNCDVCQIEFGSRFELKRSPRAHFFVASFGLKCKENFSLVNAKAAYIKQGWKHLFRNWKCATVSMHMCPVASMSALKFRAQMRFLGRKIRGWETASTFSPRMATILESVIIRALNILCMCVWITMLKIFHYL